MANFCLPKEFVTKFVQSLKDGTIDIAKMIDMTSTQRREFLTDIVGIDNARAVNALFESKLLLKDQKTGLVNWAKKTAGLIPEVKKDIIAKIERMETALSAADEARFLEDLAAKKLGYDVTFEEAQKIVDGSKAVAEAKSKIAADEPIGSDNRIEYGLKFNAFKEYISELKVKGEKPTFREWITDGGKVFSDVAGTAKSILSSLDNSFFGRQGIKTLFTDPDIWGKAFLKSWGDIAKEVAGPGTLSKGIDAVSSIKADIYSRPNALNNKYAAGGYDIGLLAEEAFPSSLPGKIPLLGRLYNASESAFVGGALRMRADLADRYIKQAEAFGVNMLDPKEAKGIGELVNSMTGKGHVPLTPGQAKFVNLSIFSIKFFKANLDTLVKGVGSPIQMAADKVAGRTRTPGEIFARRKAATNLLKITGALSSILYTVNTLFPGSVNFDPRSSDFGKIKVGGHYIDISGGLTSIITLAARLTPTTHNGKLGFWYRNKKGVWTQLNDPNFGQQNAVDVVENFIEGKASPIARAILDFYTGRDFDNHKLGFDLGSAAQLLQNSFTPLPAQTAQDVISSEDAATALGLMISDGLGGGVSK